MRSAKHDPTGTRRSRWAGIRTAILAAVVAIAVTAGAALAWLRWDAGKPRDDWFAARHGQIRSAAVEHLDAGPGMAAVSVNLESDSGLGIA